MFLKILKADQNLAVRMKVEARRAIFWSLSLALCFVTGASASEVKGGAALDYQVSAEAGDLRKVSEVLRQSRLQAGESDCYGALTSDDRQMIGSLTSRISQVCAESRATEGCQQAAKQVWLETLQAYKNQKGTAALERVLTAISAALQERHVAELTAEFSKPDLATPFHEFSRALTNFHHALDQASYQESRTKPDGSKDDSLWGRASRYTSMYLDRQFDYWLPRSTQDENRFTKLKKAQREFSAAQKHLREEIDRAGGASEKKTYLLSEVEAAVRFTNAKIVNSNQEFEETRIGYLRTGGVALLSVAAVGAAVPAMSTMVGTGVGAAGSTGMGGVLSGSVAAGAGTAGVIGTRAVVGSVLEAKVDSEHKQSRFFCELARRKAALGTDLVSEGWKQVTASMVMGAGIGGALAVLGKFSPNLASLAATGFGAYAVGKEVGAEWIREKAQAQRENEIADLARKTPVGQEGVVQDARFAARQAEARDWTERAEAAAGLAPLVIGGLHGLKQQPEATGETATAPKGASDGAREAWKVLARNRHDPLLILGEEKAAANLSARAKELNRRLSVIESAMDEIHPLRVRKAAEILRAAADDPEYLAKLVKHLGNKHQATRVINEMKKIASRAATMSREKIAQLHSESVLRSQQTALKHEIRVHPDQAETYRSSIEETRKSFREIDDKLLKGGLEKPKDLFVFYVDDARNSANASVANYLQIASPALERQRAIQRGLEIDGSEAADHEYGHAIFSQNLRRYHGDEYPEMKKYSEYSKLWDKAFDLYATKFRADFHTRGLMSDLNAEWAKIAQPTMGDRLAYWRKAAEIKLDNARTTGTFFSGKMTSAERKQMLLISDISGSYQEVFADLVSISKRGDPKAISDTLKAFRSKAHGRAFAKRFSRSMKLTKENPNQDEHHSLDGIRNMLWNGYFDVPSNKANYPKMLEIVHKTMAEEIFERVADPKLHKISDNEATRRLSAKLEKALASFDPNPKGGD